jgi:hypothetical protein
MHQILNNFTHNVHRSNGTNVGGESQKIHKFNFFHIPKGHPKNSRPNVMLSKKALTTDQFIENESKNE